LIHVISSPHQPENLDTLLTILCTIPDAHVQLPLYQLFGRLVILAKHRSALARWSPSQANQSDHFDPSSSTSPSISDTPYILIHLFRTISGITDPGETFSTRKTNAKLLEAALDALASIITGQPEWVNIFRTWAELEDTSGGQSPRSELLLVDLTLRGATTGVRIAAANW
jgi:hypothetical protein